MNDSTADTENATVIKAHDDISQLFSFHNHVDGRYATEESISGHSDT